MGEIKCAVVNSLVRGFLPDKSFEQRIEGSEEYALRLSGRRVLRRVMNKRKTPRRVYVWPVQELARGPMCLEQEGKSNWR